MGVRIVDLERDTLRIFQVFGMEEGFFQEDVRLIFDFCRGIVIVYNKFR